MSKGSNHKMADKGQRISLKKLYHQLTKQLTPLISQQQNIDAIIKKLLHHYLGVTPLDYLLDKSLLISQKQKKALTSAVENLKKQFPIQYVLGMTYFLGHKLHTSPAALIPRPETEEMLWHAIASYQGKTPQYCIDLGTGTGCIAIALAKTFPLAHVAALDVSHNALLLAQQNAKEHDVDIHFYEQDMLTCSLPSLPWELMVSNPPYIPEKERSTMATHVLAHEPHQALFVPNHDPLLFYKCIAQLAFTHLAPQGKLYVEVHEDFAQEVKTLFQKVGLHHVKIAKDMQQKPRWVYAQATLKHPLT